MVMTPLGHCRTSLTCAYSFLSSVRTDDSAGHTGIRAYLEVWAEPFVDDSDVDGFVADGQLVVAGSDGAVYGVALLAQMRVEGWRAGLLHVGGRPGFLPCGNSGSCTFHYVSVRSARPVTGTVGTKSRSSGLLGRCPIYWRPHVMANGW